MSRRRCCCAGEQPPQPYPCQPCPTVSAPLYPSWSVYVEATDIIGDKSGAGAYATGPFYAFQCEKGACGRVVHSRKAVGWPGPFPGDCADSDREQEICDALVDAPGLRSAGSSELIWRGPTGGGTNPGYCCDGLVDPQDINYADCILQYNYDQWVQIEWVSTCMKWNGCNFPQWEAAGPGHNDARTLIKVTYRYEDTFSYPRFSADPGCPRTTDGTWTSAYYWECIYARRVRPGEAFAEGAYALVYCFHQGTTGHRTYAPSPGLSADLCPGLSDTNCSADGLTPIAVSSTWQPPAYITLVRQS